MTLPIYLPENAYIGDVTYPPGGTLGPRIQLNIQLVFLQAGSMRVWVDEQQLIVQPGMVTLLLPRHRENFEFDTHQQTHHSYLHWYREPMPDDLLTYLEELPKTLPISGSMKRLLDRALDLRLSNIPTANQLVEIIATEMLWQYIGESQLEASESIHAHKNPIFAIARRFIHQHFHESVTLADIAKSASVSETHLIRIFKQHAQTTPMNYLWDLRVTQALELLDRTGLSIHEISLQCGFKTSYHFSRRIREKIGVTPTEFRKQSWAGR